jgi:1-deoxy-D-xylulose-5-phosphate synthase
MGIPDRLVEHGSPKELYSEIGLDASAIAAALREVMKEKVKVTANFQ